MYVYPFELEYLYTNVWLKPAPLLGVTESAVGDVPETGLGVHVPNCVQMLVSPPLSAA